MAGTNALLVLATLAAIVALTSCKKEETAAKTAPTALTEDAGNSPTAKPKQATPDASASVAAAADASAPVASVADASPKSAASKKPTQPAAKPKPKPKPKPKLKPKPKPKPKLKEARLPSHGKKCADGDKCAAGLECVSYYGIAGARGPKFTSCERRCGKGHKPCPGSMRCAVIADGPGQVCR